jgi:DNA-binding NarL/FixJ family response regulator
VISEHRIYCVTTRGPHKHILKVGVGGLATKPAIMYDLDQVLQMMASGERFITRSIVTRLADKVRQGPCGMNGCEVITLKSGKDAHADQVVKDLAACPGLEWS